MLKLLILLFSTSLYASNGGLEVYVAGDMYFSQGLNTSSEADEKLTMRGSELTFFSPIDHMFDGKLSAAAHDELGKTNFELHELVLSSSKLVHRSNIKVGQFFLGVGRLNRIHQHDWPFITAPKVHRTFLDDEGVFDTGLEYGYLFPSNSNYTYNMNLGITSGYRYGHSHTAGDKPLLPMHYFRFSRFEPLGTTSGEEIGISYLARTDAEHNRMQLRGVDYTRKRRSGKTLTSLIQSEVWHKIETNDNNDTSTSQLGLIFLP